MRRLGWVLVILGAAAIVCGNLVLGGLVAPRLFSVLTREQAGLAFSDILRTWVSVQWILIALVLGGLTLLAIIRLFKLHFFWFMSLAILGCGLAGMHVWSQNLVEKSEGYRVKLKAYDRTPMAEKDDPAYDKLKKTFNYLHRTASRAFLAETGVGLLMTVLAGTALITTAPRRPLAKENEEAA